MTTESSPSKSPWEVALADYTAALKRLEAAPAQAALPQVWAVLRSRDRLAAILHQAANELPPEALSRLVELDQRWIQRARRLPPSLLQDLRRTVPSPDGAWWWRPEEASDGGFPWVLLAAFFTALSLPLWVDILQRLWQGTPDQASVWGTLLAAVLAGGPYTRYGQQVLRWVGQKLRPRVHTWPGPRTFIAALLGLLFTLWVHLWGLTLLARYYNAQGVRAYQEGHLLQAQRAFQRMAAVQPGDNPRAYYHVALVYEHLGQATEAEQGYLQAIAQDLTFAPAYSNLGRLYLSQGKTLQAAQVLLAGLNQTPAAPTDLEDKVNRYALLSHLGVAYVELGYWPEARRVLSEALQWEGQVPGTHRLPDAHCALAQWYEAQAPGQSHHEWEACLRYTRLDDPLHLQWRLMAQEHLATPMPQGGEP